MVAKLRRVGFKCQYRDVIASGEDRAILELVAFAAVSISYIYTLGWHSIEHKFARPVLAKEVLQRRINVLQIFRKDLANLA